jgi:outer membrane biogenesis lipoprotein LolB
MSAWVQHVGVPALDGTYYTRMDEDDDEPLEVYVKEGKASMESGGQRVFFNFEWKKVSL